MNSDRPLMMWGGLEELPCVVNSAYCIFFLFLTHCLGPSPRSDGTGSVNAVVQIFLVYICVCVIPAYL